MSNQEIVTEAFDSEIKRIFEPKEDIKNFLLNHERKNLCIENLLKEIRVIELGGAVKLDREKIVGLGQNFAQTFAKLSLEFVERERMTAMQKKVEKDQIEENEYFEKLFNEEISEIDKSESI